MSTHRFVADYVIPGEGKGMVIPNGAIDIDSATGRIIAVGAVGELDETTGEVHRLSGALMPGLVNAHAHGPMTLVRSAGDGMPLMQWLTEGVWPREGRLTPDDVVVGMQLASCEMLLSGVTTSVEMYMFEDQVAHAVETTGGRAQVMAGVLGAVSPTPEAFTARLDAVSAFCTKYSSPEARVTGGFGPHSVYDLGPERLTELAEAAASVDAMIHVHLEETQGERQQVIDAHGRSATQVLADAGVLSQPTVAAHGVWLDVIDLGLLAQANASVVHCPMSNLKLGSGIADVASWAQAGVGQAIGTDGVASNDNLNMWEDLRFAALLARGTAHDPGAVTAAGALALATKDGAAAIGLPDVGELRPGAWADFIRIDLDQPSFAPGVEQDRFANIVWAGSPQAVTDVWVAGSHVVADRTLTTIDLDQILAAAKEAGNRIAQDL